MRVIFYNLDGLFYQLAVFLNSAQRNIFLQKSFQDGLIKGGFDGDRT